MPMKPEAARAARRPKKSDTFTQNNLNCWKKQNMTILDLNIQVHRNAVFDGLNCIFDWFTGSETNTDNKISCIKTFHTAPVRGYPHFCKS
jgi:hypothetical protein